MKLNFLDFEQPIAELEEKIEELSTIVESYSVIAAGVDRIEYESATEFVDDDLIEGRYQSKDEAETA